MAGLIATLLAAVLLDYTKQLGIVMVGFFILFFTAALARFISAYLLSKHYNPPIKIKKDGYFGFWAFIKEAPKNNFGI